MKLRFFGKDFAERSRLVQINKLLTKFTNMHDSYGKMGNLFNCRVLHHCTFATGRMTSFETPRPQTGKRLSV